jgi:hypothetical protein
MVVLPLILSGQLTRLGDVVSAGAFLVVAAARDQKVRGPQRKQHGRNEDDEDSEAHATQYARAAISPRVDRLNRSCQPLRLDDRGFLHAKPSAGEMVSVAGLELRAAMRLAVPERPPLAPVHRGMAIDKESTGMPQVDFSRRTTKVNLWMIVAVGVFFILMAGLVVYFAHH